MNFETARKIFLDGHFATNERRKKTRAAYESDLLQFQNFVGRSKSIASVKNTDLERWASYLKKKDYMPATIRRKIVVLKVFFNYWVRSCVLKETPFLRVKIQIGKIVQLPRALTENEIQLMLAHAHHRYLTEGNLQADDDKKPGAVRPLSSQLLILRNAVVVELLFATGMRVGEVSAIDIDDFTSGDSSFKVRGKGGKERLAFLVDKTTVGILAEYLLIRRQIQVDSPAFFLNTFGSRLSSQGIANVIGQMRKACGIARHITPHMLRHTVATLLLRNGVDIRIVQEFLGHASITTTQRYTQVSKEHMVRELRLRHPSLTMHNAEVQASPLGSTTKEHRMVRSGNLSTKLSKNARIRGKT